MDRKYPKRPRDLNQWAKQITDIAAGDAPELEKNAAAAALGKKDGKAWAEKRSPERRAEIAKKAAEKRWRP